MLFTKISRFLPRNACKPWGPQFSLLLTRVQPHRGGLQCSYLSMAAKVSVLRVRSLYEYRQISTSHVKTGQRGVKIWLVKTFLCFGWSQALEHKPGVYCWPCSLPGVLFLCLCLTLPIIAEQLHIFELSAEPKLRGTLHPLETHFLVSLVTTGMSSHFPLWLSDMKQRETQTEKPDGL